MNVQTAGGTRNSILEAASLELLANGYAGTSLSAIAGRLGLTKGALTYQFPTKESIVAALVERLLGVFELVDDQATEVFPAGDARTCVAFLTNLGSALVSDPLTAAPFALFADVSAPRAILQEAMNEWSRRMTAHFDGAVRGRAYDLRMTSSEAAGFAIAALSGVWVSTRLLPELGRPERRLAILSRLLGAIGMDDAEEIVEEVIAAIQKAHVHQASDLSRSVFRWEGFGGPAQPAT